MAIGLLAWMAARPVDAAPGAHPSAVNPHWKADGCASCHTMKEAKAQPIDANEAQAQCVRCHDGKSASAELHPLGQAAKAGMQFPQAWPLLNGRLGCMTCHDMKLGCSEEVRRDYSNPAMLRIVKVGHEEKPFCQSCHKPEDFPRINPHIMLTADRKPIESQCLICHTRGMDRNARERTGNAMMRAGEIQFCRSCHTRHKEQFQPGHVGHPMKPEMLAFMRVREIVGLAASPPKKLIDEYRNRGERPTWMPVGADNTVLCSTCHNPHQMGLFAPGTPLAYRPMRITGGKTISPVRGENWCNHCHDLN